MQTSMQRLCLSNEQIERLQAIIESKQNCKCQADVSFGTVWITSDDELNELRVSFLGDFELVVSRVGFTHKRRGTMTSVLEELKKICTEVGVPRIVIQSVLTPEMQAFCQAHHIEPDKNTTRQVGDVLVGDYYLMLDT